MILWKAVLSPPRDPVETIYFTAASYTQAINLLPRILVWADYAREDFVSLTKVDGVMYNTDKE